MQKGSPQNRELHITKTLNAPLETVWQAWTNPEYIVEWWGPDGFTTTIHKMEVKEGEEWLLTLNGPDGKHFPNKSIFKEVIPFKKIVYEHFNPGFIATIIFEPAENNKTYMDWSLLFETEALFDVVVKTFKADEGHKQNIVKLETFLSRNQSLPGFTSKSFI